MATRQSKIIQDLRAHDEDFVNFTIRLVDAINNASSMSDISEFVLESLKNGSFDRIRNVADSKLRSANKLLERHGYMYTCFMKPGDPSSRNFVVSKKDNPEYVYGYAGMPFSFEHLKLSLLTRAERDLLVPFLMDIPLSTKPWANYMALLAQSAALPNLIEAERRSL